jgi:DTW domain-containing protein YfiP
MEQTEDNKFVSKSSKPTKLEKQKETFGFFRNQNHSQLMSLDSEKRFDALATITLGKKKNSKIDSHCQSCWFELVRCTCMLTKQTFLSTSNIEIVMFMHFREFQRCSNTGKIIHQTFPKQSKIVILGDKNGEDGLFQCVKDKSKSTFILYPEQNSGDSNELLKAVILNRANNDTNDKENINEKEARRNATCIILLDGTWPQVIILFYLI